MGFVLYTLIIGVAAGFLASRFMKVNLGLAPTIAIGVLGALAGGAILRLGMAAFGMLGGFVGAVLGAMAVLWLYQQYFSGR